MESKLQARLAERRMNRSAKLSTLSKFTMVEDGQAEEEDEIILEYYQTKKFKKKVFHMPGVNADMALYTLEKAEQFALIKSHGDPTAVGKIWGPSKILPLLLLSKNKLSEILMGRNWFTSQKVVEIGCGWAGTAGMAAFRLGARHVILTDGEDVMVQSLSLNAAVEQSKHNKLSEKDPNHLSASVLRWGNNEDSRQVLQALEASAVDTVIGCDVFYCDPDALAMTVADHLCCRRLCLCWERRSHIIDMESRVMALLQEAGFTDTVFYSESAFGILEGYAPIDSTDDFFSRDANIADVVADIRCGMSDPSSDIVLLAVERSRGATP